MDKDNGKFDDNDGDDNHFDDNDHVDFLGYSGSSFTGTNTGQKESLAKTFLTWTWSEDQLVDETR